MRNQSNHNWTTYQISNTAPDGTLLKGEVVYWAKDYNTCLCEPFKAQSSGHHLQLAIPAIYVTDKPRRAKIHHIDLIERGREELLALYRGDVKKCTL